MPLASAVSTTLGSKRTSRLASSWPISVMKLGSMRWLRKWSIFRIWSPMTVASASMRRTSGA